ncbi:lipoprotein 17-related variable surface protein [Metamycoplasma arthritidis]|uniref:Lipoprotein n=1 Tax=Metamycoplasma arthritidis (strain 158L3-1) TaxID=243272 RepID=B3PNC9_META1|nr:lipoprotein 17-related variable surface protein [Metamycoplasma arthritidis]ACF07531.1 lipoprotein [Metamycoplasma arthritidis 158L3-1]
MKKSRKALSLLLASVLGTTLFATSVVAAACDNEEKPTPPAENPLDKANESVTLSVEGKETKKASEVKKEDVKASGFDESKFQLTVDSITAEDTKLKVKYTLKSLADNSTKEFEKTIEGFLPETPAENPLDKANESVTLSVEGKETKKASEVKKEDVKASGFDESKFQLTVDSITAEDTKLKVKYTLKSLADNSTKEFEKTIEGFLPETPAENPLDKANESVTLSVEGKETKKASEVKKEDVKASGFDESKFQLTVDSITAEDTKLKVKYTLKSLADNSTKEFEKTIEGFLPETPAENPLDKANESVTLSVEGKETKKASEVKKEDVKASGFDESKFQLTVDSITAEDTKLKVKYTLKSLADNSTKEFEKTIEGFLPETPAENPLDKANESVTLSVEGKETKKASEVKKEDVKASGFDESKFQLTVDSITAEDTKLKVKYTLKSLADNSTKEFEKTIEGFLPETPAENPLDKANESVTLSVEGKETKKASEVKKEDVKASGFDESKFQLTVDSITAEDTKLKVKYTLKSLADNSTKEFEKTIEGFLPETPAVPGSPR